MTILHDNSAETTKKKCERKYQISVINGISTGTSSYAQFGNMFHRGAQLMINGDLNPLDTMILLANEYPILMTDEKLTNQLMRLITQFHSSFTRGKSIHTEQKLLYPWPSSRVSLCGTLDYRDIFDGYLRVIDFKTGWYPDVAKIIAKYDMTSQLPFYGFLLTKLKDKILTPEELEYFNAGKVGYHYFALSATSFDTRMTSVKMIREEEARMVEEMINTAVLEVEDRWAFAEAHPSVHFPKTGMFTGHCLECDFNHICRKFNTYEESIALLEMERKPYDPTNFR